MLILRRAVGHGNNVGINSISLNNFSNYPLSTNSIGSNGFASKLTDCVMVSWREG